MALVRASVLRPGKNPWNAPEGVVIFESILGLLYI
jgi:hypothetical protein